MGLTIHLELHLDASHSTDDVRTKLGQLQAFATSIPFELVIPLTVPASREDGELASVRGWIERWADITADASATTRAAGLTAQPAEAIGFLIMVGDECDPCTIGLTPQRDASGALAGWYWYTFCKTQYATNVSEDHFLQCHTALVRLFDQAVTLGLGVTVTDEGNYWETRDAQALLAEVRTMNRLIAAVAGTLQDALGPEQRLQAPIFDHPRFERLEMGLDE